MRVERRLFVAMYPCHTGWIKLGTLILLGICIAQTLAQKRRINPRYEYEPPNHFTDKEAAGRGARRGGTHPPRRNRPVWYNTQGYYTNSYNTNSYTTSTYGYTNSYRPTTRYVKRAVRKTTTTTAAPPTQEVEIELEETTTAKKTTTTTTTTTPRPKPQRRRQRPVQRQQYVNQWQQPPPRRQQQPPRRKQQPPKQPPRRKQQPPRRQPVKRQQQPWKVKWRKRRRWQRRRKTTTTTTTWRPPSTAAMWDYTTNWGQQSSSYGTTWGYSSTWAPTTTQTYAHKQARKTTTPQPKTTVLWRAMTIPTTPTTTTTIKPPPPQTKKPELFTKPPKNEACPVFKVEKYRYDAIIETVPGRCKIYVSFYPDGSRPVLVSYVPNQ